MVPKGGSIAKGETASSMRLRDRQQRDITALRLRRLASQNPGFEFVWGTGQSSWSIGISAECFEQVIGVTRSLPARRFSMANCDLLTQLGGPGVSPLKARRGYTIKQLCIS